MPTSRRPSAESPSSTPNPAGVSVEVCYVGEAGGIEESLARDAGIDFVSVTTGQIRGRALWTRAGSLLRIARGAWQCSRLIGRYRPDVIFVTGGYVTAPLAWAASWTRVQPGRRRVPLLIYLPDMTPGMAIQWMSRQATRVAVTFPEVATYFPGKAVVTGYPVRPELLQADAQTARRALGLDEDLPVVLAFGGSRGARSINTGVVAALPTLLPHCAVLHVSGQLDWATVSEAAGRLPDTLRRRYHAYPYLHDEMVQALAAANLVIARAGASTLGEFPAVGLPSILVPYPYAGQHQHANADYLARHGAALIIEDGELQARLSPTVLDLLNTPGRLAEMAQAAAKLARPEAAWNIADELMDLARK